ncbi:MAG: hypothetical protein K9K67_10765, partial [Bacteriovoracaceae bacterium]|nr:hypothetical protein [Bacteriovoracaceae bacterium]
MKFSEELKWRGLIENTSHDEVYDLIDEGGLKFYIGFDPTSSSIQIGNFLGVVMMRRMQEH